MLWVPGNRCYSSRQNPAQGSGKSNGPAVESGPILEDNIVAGHNPSCGRGGGGRQGAAPVALSLPGDLLVMGPFRTQRAIYGLGLVNRRRATLRIGLARAQLSLAAAALFMAVPTRDLCAPGRQP